MGYHISENAYIRAQPFMDEMLKTSDDIIWVVDNPDLTPDKIAYQIRQGIATAAFKGEEDYAGLAEKFMIKSRPGKVIAERRNKLVQGVYRQLAKQLNIPEANNLNSIVEQTIKHLDQEELYFPNILNPNTELLEELYKWSSVKGFKIIRNKQGITLTKKDVGEIEWKPEEEVVQSSVLIELEGNSN